MKLTDLNPRFVGTGGKGITNSKTGEPVPERHGVGISFNCPCGCESKCFIHLENPMDGEPYDTKGVPQWFRTGEDFDTMTLRPSILRDSNKGGCGWHGFITDGNVTSV